MSLLKNTASQYVAFFFQDTTDQTGKTGDAANITAYVSLNGAAESAADNAVTEIDATNMPGVYLLQLSQAESNAGTAIVHAVSSTANIETHDVHTLHPFVNSYDGIAWEDVIQNIQAVLMNVATRSSTGVSFKKRDGTTEKVAVTHDALGARTVSTLS